MAVITCSSLLAALAEAEPDRPAITCGDDSITRAGLRDAAEQLARDLVARGVQRGDMVTIALPNSVDWFVAQHAIWRVGAIPQPVSARLPRRELEAIVELALAALHHVGDVGHRQVTEVVQDDGAPLVVGQFAHQRPEPVVGEHVEHRFGSDDP